MTLGKITSDGQVTLPIDIRTKLRLEPGDALVYEIEGDTVRIHKGHAVNSAWHGAVACTLEEWNSREDDEAFSGL